MISKRVVLEHLATSRDLSNFNPTTNTTTTATTDKKNQYE